MTEPVDDAIPAAPVEAGAEFAPTKRIPAPLDLDFALAVIRKGSLKAFRALDLSLDCVYGDGKKALECALAFAKEHQRQFPTFDWIARQTDVIFDDELKPLDPMEAYAEQIRARHTAKLVSEKLAEVGRVLKREPHNAGQSLLAATEGLRGQLNPKRHLITDLSSPESIKSRADYYQRMKAFSGELTGLPSGWPSLDKRSLGWHPKELHVFVAAEKQGKTFIASKFAGNLWLGHQKKVLFVELEMPTEQVARRIDALAAGLSYEGVKKGQLSSFAEPKYFEFLNKLKSQTRFYIVDTQVVRSVDEIAGLADDLEADIVIIDGLYILGRSGGRSERGGKGGRRDDDAALWERVLNVSAEAKEAAKDTNIPWIAMTQFSTSTEVDMLSATTRDIGYAKGMAQWADVIYGIFANEDIRRAKRRIVRTIAARDFEPIDILICFDLDTGNMSEQSVLDGDSPLGISRMKLTTSNGFKNKQPPQRTGGATTPRTVTPPGAGPMFGTATVPVS